MAGYGKQREPIDLIIAKGKKHLTKEEIAERRNSEINIDDYKNVKAPSYLSKKQKNEFTEIATKLVDIGTGTTMPENANVIVKNSNNEYTTINLNQNSTLGDLLTAMGNAGLSAQIDNDGIVSISGGTITGGTFNVAEVLGLSSEPYTARVTGNALTETIELFELVNLDTKIVDDLIWKIIIIPYIS